MYNKFGNVDSLSDLIKNAKLCLGKLTKKQVDKIFFFSCCKDVPLRDLMNNLVFMFSVFNNCRTFLFVTAALEL